MTKDEDASAAVGADWTVLRNVCCAGSSGCGRLSRWAGLPPNHTPHFHSARAFHLDGCGGFAFELRANQIMGAARDLDDPALPMRFHAARQVHRRAPEIVDELLAADHSGNHRPGIDADAERKRLAAKCPVRNSVAHVEGKL